MKEMQNMELTKHPIWEVFPNADTFEDFQKKILRPLSFKKCVPVGIKDMAIASEKLLIYSYYEYEFIDIALTQAIFTFEKALKIRWTEIHRSASKYKFKGLIDWFSDNNYFETRNERYPHILRDIRNEKVHEETKSLGGVFFMQGVYSTFDLINDLYEDPHLRIERKQDTIHLTEQLSKLTAKGTVLSYHGKRLIIFTVYPVFIDNKSQPSTLHLLVYPIFDLSDFEQGNHFVPPNFSIVINNWNFTKSGLAGTDINSNRPVALEEIKDEANLKKFEDWEKRYRSLRDWVLINFITTEPINDLFVKDLRAFHLK